MALTIADIDGTYRVSTVSDYKGPVPMQSDGVTEIKDGKTHRVDKAGVIWTTDIRIISDSEVEFISVADPRDAAADFCLTGANGQLTRDPVTYKTVMAVARKGDKIKLSGEIHHGPVSTIITMIKG